MGLFTDEYTFYHFFTDCFVIGKMTFITGKCLITAMFMSRIIRALIRYRRMMKSINLPKLNCTCTDKEYKDRIIKDLIQRKMEITFVTMLVAIIYVLILLVICVYELKLWDLHNPQTLYNLMCVNMFQISMSYFIVKWTYKVEMAEMGVAQEQSSSGINTT